MLAIIIFAIVFAPLLLVVFMAASEEVAWQEFKRETGIK